MMMCASGRERCDSEPQSYRDAELAFLALLLRGADLRTHGAVEAEERGIFSSAACNYYRASRGEWADLESAGLPIGDIPVVLHFARHAGVDSGQILEIRLAGAGWREILERFALSPDIFYVHIVGPADLPPGNAYGRYRGRERTGWNILTFRDEDVVNLVNLKFINEYYHYPPARVVALRSAGWSFPAIHAEIWRARRVAECRRAPANGKAC